MASETADQISGEATDSSARPSTMVAVDPRVGPHLAHKDHQKKVMLMRSSQNRPPEHASANAHARPPKRLHAMKPPKTRLGAIEVKFPT